MVDEPVPLELTRGYGKGFDWGNDPPPPN